MTDRPQQRLSDYNERSYKRVRSGSPTDHSKDCQNITRGATRELGVDHRPTTVKIVRI